jgi:hypothetical protein
MDNSQLSPRLLSTDDSMGLYEVEFLSESIGIDLETDFLSGGQHAIVSGFKDASAASIVGRIKIGMASTAYGLQSVMLLTFRGMLVFLAGHYVVAINGESLIRNATTFQQVE